MAAWFADPATADALLELVEAGVVPERPVVREAAEGAPEGPLAGKTVGTVPCELSTLAELGRTLAGERAAGATQRQIANAGAAGIEGVIGLALTTHGWRAVAPPGDFLRFERDGKVLSPWRTLQDVLDGKKEAAAWAQEAAAAGVADIALDRTPS